MTRLAHARRAGNDYVGLRTFHVRRDYLYFHSLKLPRNLAGADKHAKSMKLESPGAFAERAR